MAYIVLNHGISGKLLQVVLATNIAETAVTIDDVVCVINSGRMKEKSYDPYTVCQPFCFYSEFELHASLYVVVIAAKSVRESQRLSTESGGSSMWHLLHMTSNAGEVMLLRI